MNDQSVHVVKLEEELRDMRFILKSKDESLITAESERDRIKEAYELLTLPSSKERAQVRLDTSFLGIESIKFSCLYLRLLTKVQVMLILSIYFVNR